METVPADPSVLIFGLFQPHSTLRSYIAQSVPVLLIMLYNSWPVLTKRFFMSRALTENLIRCDFQYG